LVFLAVDRGSIARRSIDVLLDGDAVLPLAKDVFYILDGRSMSHRTLVGQRLIASFVLGWLLFNYPLLALFDGMRTWLGIPLLYGYLFVAWALFIGLLALIAERGGRRNRASPSAPALKD
jgi:hypothetical protein